MHGTTRLARLHRPLVLWSIATLMGCASADRAGTIERDGAAEWQTLPVDLGAPDSITGGWTIGKGPNPQIALPLDRARLMGALLRRRRPAIAGHRVAVTTQMP